MAKPISSRQHGLLDDPGGIALIAAAMLTRPYRGEDAHERARRTSQVGT